MTGRIHVLVGVDVETDVGSFTPFYEGTKHGTPRLLDLFNRKGITGTFFFVGQTAVDNPDIACLVRDAGHEIGCHSLYHETVGDQLMPIPGIPPLLQHEVEPRLALATQLIEHACGVRPVSFRCPRLFGSSAVIRALESLGYVADASYPMYFYRQQFWPYFASRDDWTQPGDSGVLEIPNFADMTMESQDPGLERDRDQWPLFRTRGADVMLDKCRSFVDFCRATGRDDAYLCFYIHPWEFHQLPASFHFGEATVIPDPFITENCGEAALDQLGELVDGLLEMGALFVTARELPAIIRAGQAGGTATAS